MDTVCLGAQGGQPQVTVTHKHCKNQLLPGLGLQACHGPPAPGTRSAAVFSCVLPVNPGKSPVLGLNQRLRQPAGDARSPVGTKTPESRLESSPAFPTKATEEPVWRALAELVETRGHTRVRDGQGPACCSHTHRSPTWSGLCTRGQLSQWSPTPSPSVSLWSVL